MAARPGADLRQPVRNDHHRRPPRADEDRENDSGRLEEPEDRRDPGARPDMSDLTVYEKPTCTTCRNLFTLLTERGIDFERVNYHVDPLPESKIRELIEKTGGTAYDGLR